MKYKTMGMMKRLGIISVLGVSLLTLFRWTGSVWGRMFLYLGVVLVVILGTLKWSGYKGASTALYWISCGFFLFAGVWLEPAGIIRGNYLYMLALLTIGLGLWDQYQLPR